jgi:EmrB/QacA subfamily drug resistance transporter
VDGIRLGTARGRWVLVATVLGSGITMLDGTVVNVALPRMGADLGADFAGLQWVVTGYTLTLASFILLGGALGDRYGRRRVFSIGIAWFAVASALCAVAPSLGWLIAGRMLQGVGGALLAPGSLAIISATFDPDDRGRAVGAWSGLGGVTTAVGPFLGGWLVEAASWRWIFLLNLPLAAAVILITARHVPESRDESSPRRPDAAGALTAAIGLGALTYGLIGKVWPVAGVGLATLAVFVAVEARSRHPMLPLSTFSNPVFRAINVLTFVIYAALSMSLFFVALVLQQALGYSPLAAGAATFPITLIMLTLSAPSGALAQRIGPRIPLVAGPLIAGCGLALFTLIQPGRPYAASVLPALVVFALGLALIVSPLTATVLSSADPRHAGVVSGVNNAVARVAGLIAVASIPLLTGFDPYRRVAPGPLVSGFHRVALVAAAACAAGAALAFSTLRERVPAPALAPAPAEPVAPGEAFHCCLDAPPLVDHTTGRPA